MRARTIHRRYPLTLTFWAACGSLMVLELARVVRF